MERKKIAISLNPVIFQACRRVKTWPSMGLALAIYVAVFALAAFGSGPLGYWGAPLVLPIIAALQGHLTILLHEGAHFLVHPDKRTNDLATDLLCGIPLLTLLRHYRTVHLAHHQYSGHPELDPERRLYADQDYYYQPQTSRVKFYEMLMKDLFGVNAVAFLVSFYRYLASIPNYKLLTREELGLGIGLWGSVFLICAWQGWLLQLAVFWFLPLFTLQFLFLKLHGYGEHTGTQGASEYERTYHHVPHLIRDFFIYPIHSGDHLQHHLYPMIPWYHAWTMQGELERHQLYRELAEPVTRSYFHGTDSIMRRQVYQDWETS